MKKYEIVIIGCLATILSILSVIMFLDTDSYCEVIGKKTSINFKKTRFDLKELKPNTKKSVDLEFLNTGKEPLIIYSVDISCECATANLPDRPIKPGNGASIKITYNAKDKGKFYKSIRVFGNFEGSPKMLSIKGECRE